MRRGASDVFVAGSLPPRPRFERKCRGGSFGPAKGRGHPRGVAQDAADHSHASVSRPKRLLLPNLPYECFSVASHPMSSAALRQQCQGGSEPIPRHRPPPSSRDGSQRSLDPSCPPVHEQTRETRPLPLAIVSWNIARRSQPGEMLGKMSDYDLDCSPAIRPARPGSVCVSSSAAFAITICTTLVSVFAGVPR